jgi:hypothetical protein
LKGLSWGYQVDSPYSEWADFSLFGDTTLMSKFQRYLPPSFLPLEGILTWFPFVFVRYLQIAGMPQIRAIFKCNLEFVVKLLMH